MGDALQIAIIAKLTSNLISLILNSQMFHDRFYSILVVEANEISVGNFYSKQTTAEQCTTPFFLCDENMPINPPTPKKEKKEI